MRLASPFICFFMAAVFAACGAFAAPDCGVLPASTVVAALPSSPFSAIASQDGCRIYVSFRNGRNKGAIGLLTRSGGVLSATFGINLEHPAADLVLTHDGTLLLAADESGAAVIDPARLAASDAGATIAQIDDGKRGAIYLALTPDDHLLFIADERSDTISVVDLVKARASGFSRDAVLGHIPVGQAPVGLAVSADGRTLFATAEIAHGSDWPGGCVSEGNGRTHLTVQGAVYVIDTALAVSDPDHAVRQQVAAGCNPVRVVLSPAGDRAYVSARGSNVVKVFDIAKLLTGDKTAEVDSIAVGENPVGVAVSPDGMRVFVTNSHRYSTDAKSEQTVSVIDVSKTPATVLGTLEVGSFPRELNITPDRKVLIVTNYGSSSLSLIDLDRLPLKPR